MSKVLSVAAIGKGSVIDHIAAGQGVRIVHLLKLDAHKRPVTLGLNLPSHKGFKDLIKIEEWTISENEASLIALFAPEATINIIENYKVIKKFQVELPQEIEGLLSCPNSQCITNHEKVPSKFRVARFGDRVELNCIYCEKSFSHDGNQKR